MFYWLLSSATLLSKENLFVTIAACFLFSHCKKNRLQKFLLEYAVFACFPFPNLRSSLFYCGGHLCDCYFQQNGGNLVCNFNFILLSISAMTHSGHSGSLIHKVGPKEAKLVSADLLLAAQKEITQTENCGRSIMLEQEDSEQQVTELNERKKIKVGIYNA